MRIETNQNIQNNWASSAMLLLACLLFGIFGIATAVAQTTSVVIPGYGVAAFAGTGTSGTAGNGGLATAATLTTPYKTAFDAAGNLYIADLGGNAIRMVSASTGLISTIAGGGTGTCTGATDAYGNGCAPASSILSSPDGLAFDPSGNLYVSDSGHFEVRKITSPSTGTGLITIYAGTGSEGCPTAGTLANANPFDTKDIVFDTTGNAYVALYGTHCHQIEKIDTTGKVTTFEGNFSSSSTPCSAPPVGYVSGTTTATQSVAAYLCDVESLAIDKANNVYLVATTYNSIIKMSTTATSPVLTTVAGSMTATKSETGDGGLATTANLNGVGGAYIDGLGNLFITESTGNRVREVVAATGKIYTVAGAGAALTNGGVSALATSMSSPIGITGDSSGNLLVADENNHEVRKLSSTPQFTATQVGASATGNQFLLMTQTAALKSVALKTTSATPDYTLGTIVGCTVNGTTTNALGTACTVPVTFKPQYAGVRQLPLLVTDTTNAYLGLAITGTGTAPVAGLLPGTISSVASTATLLKSPLSNSAVDADGNLYVADTGNNLVRVITPAGVASIFAGTGTAGYTGDNGVATAATLSAPGAVAVDPYGNVYIADTGNNAVRVVNPLGTISTYAGTGAAGVSGNGAAATAAQLNGPAGLVTDVSGNLYIADTLNNQVRLVNRLSGIITLVAGTSTASFTGDGGAATAATLKGPQGLALDASNNLYLADTANHVVRTIASSTGIISTLAGQGGTAGYSGDGGTATAALLYLPSGVALDAGGNLYIADPGSSVIRMVSQGVISTLAGNANLTGYTGDGGTSTGATLNQPFGLSVSPSDILYVVDAGNNVVRAIALTATPAIQFPNTVLNTASAPQTVTVDNLGNATLSLASVVTTAPFAQQATTATNGVNCGTSGTSSYLATLNAGVGCSIALVFTPTALTTSTGSLTVTDNAANIASSQQKVTLSGKGVSALGVLTVKATSVTYPTASQATIAVASSGSFGTPTGSVSYYLDGVTTSAQTANLTAGAVSFSLGVQNSGTHLLTVTYTGDTNYGTSTVTTSFVVAGTPVALAIATTPASPTFGVALSTTVTASVTGGAAVTGKFTYALDGGLTTSLTLVNSAATFSLGTPSTGTHTLSVTYGGNAQDAVQTQTATIVVAPAPTTVTLATSSANVVIGTPFSLTATVSDAVNLTPLGSVQFMDGTTALCTVPLTGNAATANLSALATATCTGSSLVLSVGSHTLTAQFLGSTNFAPSTSAALTQVSAPANFTLLTDSLPQVGIAAAPITSVTIADGQSSQFEVIVNGNSPVPGTINGSVYAYAGTVTLSCSNLPAFMGCLFQPNSLALTNGTTNPNGNTYCPTPATTTTCVPLFPSTYLTIQTFSGGTSRLMNPSLRGQSNSGIFAASLLGPGLLLAGLLGLRRRQLSPQLRGRLTMFCAILMLGAVSTLSGCGYNLSSTPKGTYNINIIGTDSVNNVVQTTVFPVTVN